MQVWLDYHLQKRRFVSMFFVPYEWMFLHDSDPWQEHKSVHARFCSAQTQDFLHCDFPLHGLVRLPSSEAALRRHILCASLQTKVWHAFCLVKSPLPSPMEYGWRTVKDSLHPVYFEGNMSAEFLRDLVCSCKGKSQYVMMGGCKRLLIIKPSYKS
jgi:hypothetical protein